MNQILYFYASMYTQWREKTQTSFNFQYLESRNRFFHHLFISLKTKNRNPHNFSVIHSIKYQQISWMCLHERKIPFWWFARNLNSFNRFNQTCSWNKENPFTFEISEDLQIFSFRIWKYDVWNFNPFFSSSSNNKSKKSTKSCLFPIMMNWESWEEFCKSSHISNMWGKLEIESFFYSFETHMSASWNVIKTKIINSNNISSHMLEVLWELARYHNRQSWDDFLTFHLHPSIPFPMSKSMMKLLFC